MKQAIQFGAGNIGRGFIGALLSGSGYHVVFADVNTQMIDALNATGKYRVYITDLNPENFEVAPVSALHTSDATLVERIVDSEVITTAVGLGILPRVAPVIARGIEERAKRGVEQILHVIACENGVRASSRLKDEVLALLSPQAKEYSEKLVGFLDCSVDRIVPPVKTENPSDVCVERFHEWNVDRTQLKGVLQIDGMNPVDNLSAYVERKLFTLNTGHAVLAYIGKLKGYERIEDCIADAEVLSIVRGGMSESGAVLVRKFGLDSEAHAAYCEKILQRFRNHYLGDTVDRIGRDPLRKLSAGDRLIAPLTAAYGYGLPIENLLLGVGAALHYDNPEDAESVRLQDTIARLGIVGAVEELTGIVAGSPLNERIVKAYGDVMVLF